MTTQDIRNLFKMSQVDFSKRFSIPLDLVRYWDETESMPTYLYNILYEFKILESTKNDLENMYM